VSLSNDAMMAQAQRGIARAWAGEAFKAALLADPKATLAQEGIALPEGITLKVVADTRGTMPIGLSPPKHCSPF